MINKNKLNVGQEMAILHEYVKIVFGLIIENTIKSVAYTYDKDEFLTFIHGGELVTGANCYVIKHSRIRTSKCNSDRSCVSICHQVNIFDNDTHLMNSNSAGVPHM
jgi:hypothetical protein